MVNSVGVHGSMGLQIACNGALKSLGRPARRRAMNVLSPMGLAVVEACRQAAEGGQ